MPETLAPGERVRVREDFPPGHFRTPVYIRGKVGVVTRRFGEFGDPERLALRLVAPKRGLYEVRFRQVDVWPDYRGAEHDCVDIDLFDHWLERV
jgi:nitrile hydratase